MSQIIESSRYPKEQDRNSFRPSDTQVERNQARGVAREIAEKGMDKASLYLTMLDQAVPISLLLPFGDWFPKVNEDETKFQITETMLMKEDSLLSSPDFELLRNKVMSYKEDERIENSNPRRASVAMTVLTPATAVVLDHPKYIGRRGKTAGMLVTNQEMGFAMEKWLEGPFDQIAELSLKLMHVIGYKKRAGIRARIMKSRLDPEKIVMMEEEDVLQIRREMALALSIAPVGEATIRGTYLLGQLTRVFLAHFVDDGKKRLLPEKEALINKLLG